jgi:hypothetical protein
MASCEIDNDIIYDCTTPAIAGAQDEIIIVPRRSVVDGGITINATNHLIVEGIGLESGERAYKYTGNGDLRSITDQLVKDDSVLDTYMESLL